MIDRMDDQNLRERFAQVLREDRAITPAFLPLVPRFGRTVRSRHVLAAVAAVALGVVVARWATADRLHVPQMIGSIDMSATMWTSPTDFLLQTPGRALLNTFPAVTLPDLPTVGQSNADDTL